MSVVGPYNELLQQPLVLRFQSQLKRMYAELALDNAAMKDLIAKKL